MLSFMLKITVKEEFLTKASAALSNIDKIANTHEGCISFMWFQEIDKPEKFLLIENWRSQEDLDNHIKKIDETWNKFTPYLNDKPVSVKLNKLVKLC